jgi:glycerate kinase
MNVLIAFDKFKGSLSAAEVCRAIASGIQQVDHLIRVVETPIADGGDGTLNILKTDQHFKVQRFDTIDPLGRAINAVYLSNGYTAFIELAEASGIQHLVSSELNILHATTVGTGKLIFEAIQSGHREIVLSIGGSCTNDLGIGILDALGFQFLDKSEERLDPIGANLLEIADIITPESLSPLRWTILCDVENLLYGSNGAAVVYGPQKGATPSDINYLEKASKHFSSLVKNKFDKDISTLKGGGAAGGIAAGLFGLLDNVVIENGFDYVAEKLELKSKIEQADFVITGEGKFDTQSLQGKVVGKMIELCQELNTPVSVVAGAVELSDVERKKLGIKECYALFEMAGSLEDSMKNASKYLKELGYILAKQMSL